MAENINKRPARSILKGVGSGSGCSTDVQGGSTTTTGGSACKRAKEQRFDEMNILATLHPPDKDYGHMKIDEAKTPYAEYEDETLELRVDELDANLLAAKLNAKATEPPAVCNLQPRLGHNDETSDASDLDETPHERQLRLDFEGRRKKHYNEFQAIQLARKLMQEEDDDNDDDGRRPDDSGFMQEKRDAEKTTKP